MRPSAMPAAPSAKRKASARLTPITGQSAGAAGGALRAEARALAEEAVAAPGRGIGHGCAGLENPAERPPAPWTNHRSPNPLSFNPQSLLLAPIAVTRLHPGIPWPHAASAAAAVAQIRRTGDCRPRAARASAPPPAGARQKRERDPVRQYRISRRDCGCAARPRAAAPRQRVRVGLCRPWRRSPDRAWGRSCRETQAFDTASSRSSCAPEPLHQEMVKQFSVGTVLHHHDRRAGGDGAGHRPCRVVVLRGIEGDLAALRLGDGFRRSAGEPFDQDGADAVPRRASARSCSARWWQAPACRMRFRRIRNRFGGAARRPARGGWRPAADGEGIGVPVVMALGIPMPAGCVVLEQRLPESASATRPFSSTTPRSAIASECLTFCSIARRSSRRG